MRSRLPGQGVFRAVLTAAIFFSLQSAGFCADAEPEVVDEPVAPAVPILDKLPEPNATLQNGLVINNYNVNEYQELLVPELLSVLRSGEVHLEVFSRLPFDLSLGTSYAAESVEPALTEAGAMKEPLDAVAGPLFTSISGVAEQDGSPARLLWNTQAAWWAASYVRSELAVHFVRNDTGFRTFKGFYERIYPRSLSKDDKTDQLFRERLSYTSPGIIKDFSWLRFRFQSAERDVLFMYSPVTKQTRQLTSSNGSDSLLGSSMSLDDSFVWNGKVSEVHGQVDGTQTVLMPVVSLNQGIVSYSTREACETYEVNQGSGLWNYATRAFPSGAAWLPTLAVYVPRVMHKITLNPDDPYSAYGRQVLYTDSELGVPVYKIVYDPTGSIWKIIIGVYGFSPEHDRRRAMTLLQQIIIDKQADQIILLENGRTTTCSSLDVAAVLKTFTPTALVPAPAEEVPASPPVVEPVAPAVNPGFALPQPGVPQPSVPEPVSEPVTVEEYLNGY
jgi:hypothetical protein